MVRHDIVLGIFHGLMATLRYHIHDLGITKSFEDIMNTI